MTTYIHKSLYYKIIVLIISLWLVNSVKAQTCPSELIFITSQTEVDNFFTNYETTCSFTGGISISGPDIVNLDGLTGLTSIEGAFTIHSNDLLTDLSGLGALTSVGGGLDISNNGSLSDISSSSFSALNSVEYLVIGDNPSLTSINGFLALTNVQVDFYIERNPVLTNVNGLSALETIGGPYLLIDDNPLLTDISGLSTLNSISGFLQILNNTSLTNLNGLSGLSSIDGNLHIINNDALPNLNDLVGLSSINGDLLIQDNEVLSNCNIAAICDTYVVTGIVTIANNAGDCFNNTTANLACTPSQNSFITTWQTTSPNESITIPTFLGETYEYNVNWGDGIVEKGFNGDAEHTYISEGIYTVTISGNFPRIYFNRNGDRRKIVAIIQWGSMNWSSMENAFFGCENLNVVAIDIPNLQAATSLSAMFRGCSVLIGNSAFDNWDVSTISDLSWIFAGAQSFNQNIDSWDVSEVRTLERSFAGAFTFDQPLNSWDVSRVENLNNVFGSAYSFNQPLNSWNVSNVITASEAFQISSFNQDLSNWDVSNITSMKGMFQANGQFDYNLAAWDISSVTDMSLMFETNGMSQENYDATLQGWATLDTGENQIPPNINFHGGNSQYCSSETKRQDLIDDFGWNITDGGKAVDCVSVDFSNAFVTTWQTTTANESITIPTFNFPGETYDYAVDWGDGTIENELNSDATHLYVTPGEHNVSITGIFPRIYFLNNDVAASNREKILSIVQWGNNEWSSMEYAFIGAANLDVVATDLPNFTQLDNLSQMFNGCSSLVGNPSFNNWDVSNVVNLSSMFFGASVFNQNISNWNVENVQLMYGLFGEATMFNQPLNSWQTNSLIYMPFMLSGATSFNQPLDNWDVSQVTDMGHLFSGATSFNQPLDTWVVDNVTRMSFMFKEATSFNQPLESWNVGNVRNMEEMFNGASSFNQPIGNWDVSKVENMFSMFNTAIAFDQNIGNWDIGSLIPGSFDPFTEVQENSSAMDMFTNTGLSTENYDALLIGWGTLDTGAGEIQIPEEITLNAGDSKFCDAEAVRLELMNTHIWTITDNGKCESTVLVLDPDGSLDISDGDGTPSDDNFTLSLNGNNLVLSNSVPITISGDVVIQVDANTIEIPLASITNGLTIDGQGGNDTLTLDTSLALLGPNNGLTLNGINIQLSGTGNLQLNALNVSNGNFDTNGLTTTVTTVANFFDAATLTGTGIINGVVYMNVDSNLNPGTSPGILYTGDLVLDNNNNNFEINGPSPGTEHDQVVVTGTVTIVAGTTLNLIGGYTNVIGDEIILIDNVGTEAITGTFEGLAEGAVINDDFVGTISYVGGDGNDVSLIANLDTEISFNQNGQLILTDTNGGNSDDEFIFSVIGNNLRISNANPISINGTGIEEIDMNTVEIPLASITDGIVVDGGDGIDTLTIDSNLALLGTGNDLTVTDADIFITGNGILQLNALNVYAADFDTSGLSTEVTTTANFFNDSAIVGTGTLLGILNMNAFSTVAPGASPGILNTENLILSTNSAYEVEYDATAPGIKYDQINVTGSVTIENNVLLDLNGDFPNISGAELMIINNDGVDPVSGTFQGLVEGAAINDDFVGTISYVGGDGNDVVLFNTIPVAEILVTLTPENGSFNVPVNQEFSVVFNQIVQSADDNLFVNIFEPSSGGGFSTLEDLSISNGGLVLTDDGTVSTLTITPQQPLPANKNLYINIASGHFSDNSGNPWAGINAFGPNSDVWQFTTEFGDTPCVSGDLDLEITFDNFAEETFWRVINADGSAILASASYTSNESNTTITEQIINLPDGTYQFIINDSFGDGICCGTGNGSYKVTKNNVELFGGGRFGNSQSFIFCIDASIDSEIPEITCPSPIAANAGAACSTIVAIVDPTASDDVSTSFTFEGIRSDNQPLTNPFFVGKTTITWTATDEAGNISESCDQTITVNGTGDCWFNAGPEIVGGTENRLGAGVSINSDGTIIAYVIPDVNGSGTLGEVTVLQNQNGVWNQLGATITGGSLGRSLSGITLNDAGDRLAVSQNNGDVQVFSFNGSTWQTFGGIITTAGQAFIQKVDFDAMGSRLVVGYSGENLETGRVVVYEFQNGNWSQLGQQLNGDNQHDFFGRDVSLNAAGSRIAVGAYQVGNTPGGALQGYVKIFELVSGNWSQLGDDIIGDSNNDFFGVGVSLNDNGNRVVIGANAGRYARVYEFANGAWNPLGGRIADFPNEQVGYQVDINGLGDVVLIGNFSQPSRVYQWANNSWQLLGNPIYAGVGQDVAINKVGNIFVAGTPDFNDRKGKVAIFEYSGELQIPETEITLSAEGSLVISDIGGNIDDAFELSLNGSNLRIFNSASAVFISGSGMVQIDANTVEIPLASITNGITLLGAGGTNSLQIDSAIQLSGTDNFLTLNNLNIQVTGTGPLQLNALNVTGGDFGTNGLTTTIITEANFFTNATLSGTGTMVGVVNMNVDSNLAPGTSPGILTTGDLTFTNGSLLNAEVYGPAPGSDVDNHDQLIVTGTVTIQSGAILNLIGGFANGQEDIIVLIANDGTDPITGTFDGLDEGVTVSFGDYSGTISYMGGTDNNDLVLLSPVPNPATTLIITEIMYNPDNSDNAWEYIEIYNNTTDPIDLTGYVIDDNTGAEYTEANITSGSIAPGESAIVFNGSVRTAEQFEQGWGQVNMVPATRWSALNNGGDTIGIWTSFASYQGDSATQENVIEQVIYENNSNGWPDDDGFASIYLSDLEADNTMGSNWTLSVDGSVTPVFNNYTFSPFGNNEGLDIGSPGIPAPVDNSPVITCPANVTVNARDSTSPSNTGDATATGGFGVVGITFTDSSTPDGQIITRTWIATDANGGVSSCDQTITVIFECDVTILQQPQDVDVTVCDIEPLGIFRVEASGSGALTYLWEEKVSSSCCTWSALTVNDNTLEITTEALAAANGSKFRVTVTSDNGTPGDITDDCSVTSDEVTLTTVSLEPKPDIPVNLGLQTNLGGGLPGQGTQLGDLGVYSGPGVIDDGNGLTYSFDPEAAGEGIKTITYTYTNGNGCTSAASDDILIFPAMPLLSINDVSQVEGTGGITSFVFDVRLSEPSTQIITVGYSTFDNIAVSPDDYDTASGNLTFNPGETFKNITINIVPDSEIEQDETFLVQLSGAGGDAWYLNYIGTGTILNDDQLCALVCNITQDVLSTDHLTTDGVATVTTTGGTGQFTYLWDNGETTQTATTLTYGMHSVTVTDSNGCETTCQIDIAKELYCWTNLVQNVSVLGGNDGAARVYGNGGYRPHSFKWDDGSTEALNTNLSAGTHYVTITDATGATSQCSVTISEPTGGNCDTFTVSVVQDVLSTNHLTDDGAATVYPKNGTAPYTYVWDNGETTQTATTLTYGMHTVTVTDASGCETSSQIDIAKELYCWINLHGNVSVHGGTDGVAKVYGNGGYRPHTFKWEDGSTEPLNTNLSAGTHYVTITDATGATSRCSVTISEPNQEICDGIDNDGDGKIDEGFDQDGDGIADCFDECDNRIDTDGDGTPDCSDPCDDSIDTDGDGTPDCIDQCDDRIDSDGDGIPDCTDPCDDSIDTDRDGTPDCVDPCDDSIDSDNDGTPDCTDPCDNRIDTDGDGITDCLDICTLTITGQPVFVERCLAYGDVTGLTVTVEPNNGATVAYQWQQSVNSGAWSTITSATTNMLTNIGFDSPNFAGNISYRVIAVSDNGTPNDITDDCTVTSTTAAIYSLPAVTFLLPAYIQVDDAPIYLNTGSPVGGRYSGNGVGDDFNGRTIFDPAQAGVGVHTVTYTYTNENNCTQVVSNQIEVSAIPGVNCSIVILDQPEVAEPCLAYGDVTSLSVSIEANNGPTFGYEWQESINGGAWSPITSATTNILTNIGFDSPIFAGNIAFRAVVVSDNGTPNDITDDCTVTSETATIYTLPEVTLQLPSEFLVNDGPISLSTGSPMGGTYSGNGVGSDPNGRPIFDPAQAGVGTHIITYEYSNDGGCSNMATHEVTVSMVPVPLVVYISEYQPNPDGVDPSTQVIELKGPSGVSFNGWIILLDGDGSASGGVDSAHQVTGVFDGNGLLEVTINNIENPSHTIILSENYDGSITDFDGDNDGQLDVGSSVELGTIYDALGVPDSSVDEANLFGEQLGGTDFTFTGDEPQLVFRDSQTNEWFAVNDHDVPIAHSITAIEIAFDQFIGSLTAPTLGEINPLLTSSTRGLKIQVWPNPSVKTINLQLSKTDKVEIYSIHDMTGKLIRVIKANHSLRQQLDIEDLQTGVYMIRASGANMTTVSQKFIKRN